MSKKLPLLKLFAGLMLLLTVPAFGQTFWGMTSSDNIYGGGTIFSYHVQTNTYKDEFFLKPSPVYNAINVFEETPRVYVGVCERSWAKGIYQPRTGSAIYRYNALKDTTEIVDVLPGYFTYPQYKDGEDDIIYFNHSIVGMLVTDEDSMTLINYSISNKSLRKIKVFNINSWPGDGNTSYDRNFCYFSPVNDTMIIFSLGKNLQEGGSNISYQGRDFFAYNPLTGKVGLLFVAPATDRFIFRGPFVKTSEGRLFAPVGNNMMELHLSDSSYTVFSPFSDGTSLVNGKLYPASDTTLIGLRNIGNSSFLFEYDFKNDTVLKDATLYEKTYFYNFVKRGDSLYFAVNFTGQFPKIMAYKPGGDDPVNSFQLTQYQQNSLRYLVNTSDAASILAAAYGLADYFVDKHAYINLTRFSGVGTYYSYKNGASPAADLLLASDGKLYGMMPNGGAGTFYHGDGVLFSIDPQTGEYHVLVNFTGENGGFGSRDIYGTHYGKGQNNLLEYNGKIYGTTYTNGDDKDHPGPGYGTVFTYDISRNYDNFRKIYDFNDSVDASAGRLPMSGLTLGPDDKLYGTTSTGGTGGIYGHGVLYVIDPANSDAFQVVLKIPDTCLRPVDNLVLADNGKMYGLATAAEFHPNYREVYWAIREYDVANKTFKDIYVSDKADAEYSYSQFLYLDNKLYGMVARSTDDRNGYLYEYDLATNQLIKRVVFLSDGHDGGFPMGNLTLSSTGSLWGMTSRDQSSVSYGIIFEYNPADSSFTNHYEFDGKSGVDPVYTCLTEVKGDDTPVEETKAFTHVKAYPNPTTNVVKFDFETAKVQNVHYTVSDAMGRQITSASVQVSGYVILNFSGFKPGAYFVRLSTPDRTYSATIIRK